MNTDKSLKDCVNKEEMINFFSSYNEFSVHDYASLALRKINNLNSNQINLLNDILLNEYPEIEKGWEDYIYTLTYDQVMIVGW